MRCFKNTFFCCNDISDANEVGDAYMVKSSKSTPLTDLDDVGLGKVDFPPSNEENALVENATSKIIQEKQQPEQTVRVSTERGSNKARRD